MLNILLCIYTYICTHTCMLSGHYRNQSIMSNLLTCITTCIYWWSRESTGRICFQKRRLQMLEWQLPPSDQNNHTLVLINRMQWYNKKAFLATTFYLFWILPYKVVKLYFNIFVWKCFAALCFCYILLCIGRSATFHNIFQNALCSIFQTWK